MERTHSSTERVSWTKKVERKELNNIRSPEVVRIVILMRWVSRSYHCSLHYSDSRSSFLRSPVWLKRITKLLFLSTILSTIDLLRKIHFLPILPTIFLKNLLKKCTSICSRCPWNIVEPITALVTPRLSWEDRGLAISLLAPSITRYNSHGLTPRKLVINF